MVMGVAQQGADLLGGQRKGQGVRLPVDPVQGVGEIVWGDIVKAQTVLIREKGPKGLFVKQLKTSLSQGSRQEMARPPPPHRGQRGPWLVWRENFWRLVKNVSLAH